MKGRLFCTTFIFVAAIFLAGCQTTSLYSTAGFVLPEDLVSISPDDGAGTWKGKDLDVDFKYSRAGGSVDFLGAVHWADHITYNFSRLVDFQISVIFTDRNGKVLAMRSIATNRGSLDPVPFRIRLAMPPDTASLAFSYRGNASEGGNDDGGGGPTYFWQHPVRTGI